MTINKFKTRQAACRASGLSVYRMLHHNQIINYHKLRSFLPTNGVKFKPISPWRKTGKIDRGVSGAGCPATIGGLVDTPHLIAGCPADGVPSKGYRTLIRSEVESEDRVHKLLVSVYWSTRRAKPVIVLMGQRYGQAIPQKHNNLINKYLCKFSEFS